MDEHEIHAHLIEAVMKRFNSSDFDDHIHELKSKEASAINNAGPEEQLKYLIEQCGEDWVREVFLPKTDLPDEPDMIERLTCSGQKPLWDLAAFFPQRIKDIKKVRDQLKVEHEAACNDDGVGDVDAGVLLGALNLVEGLLRDVDLEGTDFDIDPALAKDGFWLTVGKASIHIKDGDDGISVSVYAKDAEMEDALGETWVTHGELEGEDTE